MLVFVLSSLVAVRPPKQALLVRVRTASGTLYAMEHRFFQSCLLFSKVLIMNISFFFFYDVVVCVYIIIIRKELESGNALR